MRLPTDTELLLQEAHEVRLHAWFGILGQARTRKSMERKVILVEGTLLHDMPGETVLQFTLPTRASRQMPNIPPAALCAPASGLTSSDSSGENIEEHELGFGMRGKYCRSCALAYRHQQYLATDTYCPFLHIISTTKHFKSMMMIGVFHRDRRHSTPLLQVVFSTM